MGWAGGDAELGADSSESTGEHYSIFMFNFLSRVRDHPPGPDSLEARRNPCRQMLTD
jgi:hypothetical protein